MSDSDSSFSLSEFRAEWTCESCKVQAKNPLTLEFQLLPGDKVFLIDSNGDIWLYCWGCRLCFHFKCAFELPADVTEEDIGPRYYCVYCENV